ARCAYGSSGNSPCGGAGVLQVATADSRSSVVTPGSDEPTAQAHAVMERVLALVRECRLVLRKLEHPATLGESPSAEAERIFYHTLISAIDTGLIKTMEDALQFCVMRASRWGRWVRSGWSGRRGRWRRGVSESPETKRPQHKGRAVGRDEGQCFV